MAKKKTSRYDAEAKKALRDSGVKTIQVRVPDLSRFHPDGYGGGAIIAVEVLLPQASVFCLDENTREPGCIGKKVCSALPQYYVYNEATKRIEVVKDFKKLFKRYKEGFEKGKSFGIRHSKNGCMSVRILNMYDLQDRSYEPVEYANEKISNFVQFCEQPAPAAAPAAPKQADPAPAPAAPKQAEG